MFNALGNFNQCRNMGVMWLDLGALTTARGRVLDLLELGDLIETWAGCDKASCSSQAWSEQWKWR